MRALPPMSDTPRMAPLSRLPVFLTLAGKGVLVAGGSAAAAWKAELLSAAGAEVHVFALQMSEDMLRTAAQPPSGPVTLHASNWDAADLNDMALAIGAFDDDGEAARFADAARALKVPCNVIDKPAFCSFAFGAIVNRSPLVVGISTDGAAPSFAQAIRTRIEALLPTGFARWAKAARTWRAAVKQSGLSIGGRRRFWQLFAQRAVINPDRAPDGADFKLLLSDAFSVAEAGEPGSVALVGAGPGDPELLTLRAARALRSADVILFDHQVSADILDFSRREAKKMLVGATDGEQSIALALRFATHGKRVVRLVAGDPLRSPNAAPELTVYRAAGVEIELIPGIADVGETARTDRDASSTIPSDRSHRPRKSDPSAAS